jgi:L,D-transpeptidase YcbB
MSRFLTVLALLGAASAYIMPAAAQPAQWTKADAEELLGLVEDIRSEGLDPADYNHADLRQALAAGTPEQLDRSATAVFMHLAADLSHGHVQARARLAWHIAGTTLSDSFKQGLMAHALARRSVRQTLTSLLPTHAEYGKLKAALAATPQRDRAAIQRLRANLERWRWMPRSLGRRYLLVNVPAFELALVEDGKIISRHRIIVGKPGTPTPQFNAMVEAVQLNPSWYVPSSIVAESVGKLVQTQPQLARQRGYVVSKNGIRQLPGPSNALGQMKLVMPNPYTVYIHDTPTKALFDEEVRAFSHGCIRTENPFDLAAVLLAGDSWSRERVDSIVATRVTTEARLADRIPVYVTYFTAATDESGGVASYPDIYGRDGPVVANLIDREPPDPLGISASAAAPAIDMVHHSRAEPQ